MITITTSTVTTTEIDTTVVTDTTTLVTTVLGAPGQYVKRSVANPTVPTWATKSCSAAAFSSACSCWGIHSGSTTYTTTASRSVIIDTSTVTATATVTRIATSTLLSTETDTATYSPTCSRGLQYAFYKASPGTGPGEIPINPANGYYTEINSKVDEIKTWAPQATGVTDVLGGIESSLDGSTPPVVYDYTGPQGMTSEWIAVDHRGYLFTRLAGAYTVTYIYNNEVCFAWIGDNVGSQVWDEPPTSVPVSLPAGIFVPLRFLFVNAEGGSAFFINVTAPDGTVILGQFSTPNDYVLQSCDQGPAVPYAPWGTPW